MDVTLFGAKAHTLAPLIEAQESLNLVNEPGDVIVCFGGDGTLLAAELRWPNVPKVPIRNSRRGIRCIAQSPVDVITLLANEKLVRTEHMKIECQVNYADPEKGINHLLAVNEFAVHMGRVNSAVRFKIWFDGNAHGEASDREIIGDGLVISTPFGSTAYFNEVTRGIFLSGIGVAFMNTHEKTNHVILPEESSVRTEITRGPATLAYDNAAEYIELVEGDELTIQRHSKPAVILVPEG
jgi:NAD+ kinase